MESQPASWRPDPLGRYEYRYWNGTEWTADVSTAGSQEKDPNGLAPNPAATPVPVARVAPARLTWPNDVRALVFVGAAMLIAGSLLPWVKAQAGFFTATKNGIEGDGVLTLLLGAAIALSFLLTRAPKTAAWLVIAFAGIATAIAVYDIVDVSQKAEDLANQNSTINVSASVGVGLWVAVLGGAVALVGGLLALKRGSTSS